MSVGEDRFLLLASVLGELGLRNGCKDCTKCTTHKEAASEFAHLSYERTLYVGKFAKRERETGREGRRAQILSCLRGFGLYGWLLGVCGESGFFFGVFEILI